ncbi:MAG: MurR/RpiR family transcriptional regulator [Sandaracinus sp.]|nr:MurR/RpiR family transcriptional regulator [Sandaracinus sp.]
MSRSREADFRRRVVDTYEELPPQQQLVADWVLDHLKDVPFASVPDLAARSGASEATVVRFAQRLGFDGFTGLRNELIEVLREEVQPEPRGNPALVRMPEGDTLAAVARQEAGNIHRSIDALDRAVVSAVADLLFEAEHVYVYGRGISAHLAGLASYLLLQLGRPSSVVSPALGSPREALVAVRSVDALLVLSFPPYSKDTVELARAAARSGCAVVGITDRETAPIASSCTHVLPVRCENMMYTGSVSAVSALLNGLCTEIAVRHPERTAAAVERITALLAEDDGHL